MNQHHFDLHGLNDIEGVDSISLSNATTGTVTFVVLGSAEAIKRANWQIMLGRTSAQLDGVLISLIGNSSTEVPGGYRFECRFTSPVA